MVVPVYRGGEAFARCLDALAALDPAPAELIVVADGAVPDDCDLAAARGLRCLALGGPQGPGIARNHGVSAVTTDLVLFVDADVCLHRDAVARVCAAFSDPSVAAVFGSYDDSPPASGLVSQFKNLSHHYVHQRGSREASTFWAGCGAVRREPFLSVSGFDSRYRRPCIEDIDLGYRLRAAGHRIRLDPDLQAAHLKRWTLRSALRSDLIDRAAPWTELIHRSGNLPRDLNLDICGRLAVLLSGLLPLLFGAAVVWGRFPLFAALAVLAALLLLHGRFFVWLLFRRGPLFALAAVPLHLCYLWCAGLGFALGSWRYWFGRSPAATAD